jgi:lysophospholipase
MLSIAFISLSSISALALNESTVVSEIKGHVLSQKACPEKQNQKFWTTSKIKTKVHLDYWVEGDYNLVVSKFGCEIGNNGSVVISPGRTESSVEFYETALDLIEKGFSPIYVVDHVGQGFSPRLLPDHNKGHINSFDDYINAFDSAVVAVEKDLKNKEGRSDKNRQPLFFLSNSMGGTIGIGYFQKKGASNPFKAAALLGPMIRINYLGFPNDTPNGITHPTRKQTLIFREAGVIAQAHYFCARLGCDAYATKIAQEKAKIHGTSYLEGERDFELAFAIAPEQVMTHSKQRYDLRTFLWENPLVKALYEKMDLGNPQLGAPSFQWVKQAAKFNFNMRRTKNVKKMSTMPIQIITGEKDVRAYTPSSDGSTDLNAHIDFCNKINVTKGLQVCKFEQIDKAFHELMKETEVYRKPTMERVVEHFLAD